jgi:hypothetical protein
VANEAAREPSPAANEEQDGTDEITRRLANRESIPSGPQRGVQTELVVPPAQLPTLGKFKGIVCRFALDAAAAPVVDVSAGWTVEGMAPRAQKPASGCIIQRWPERRAEHP